MRVNLDSFFCDGLTINNLLTGLSIRYVHHPNQHEVK
jgi:hypothetical protein